MRALSHSSSGKCAKSSSVSMADSGGPPSSPCPGVAGPSPEPEPSPDPSPDPGPSPDPCPGVEGEGDMASRVGSRLEGAGEGAGEWAGVGAGEAEGGGGALPAFRGRGGLRGGGGPGAGDPVEPFSPGARARTVGLVAAGGGAGFSSSATSPTMCYVVKV